LFEIEDAAKIDGCGPFAISWRRILPLSKPGIFASGLIVFIFLGMNFLFPQFFFMITTICDRCFSTANYWWSYFRI
tara:strand:- start:234 stop:461 length:228 start_codon:yes stop_codon:yes gene_type:complete